MNPSRKKQAKAIKIGYELVSEIKENHLNEIAKGFLANKSIKEITDNLIKKNYFPNISPEIARHTCSYVLKGVNGNTGVFTKNFYNMIIGANEWYNRSKGGKNNNLENIKKATRESIKKRGFNNWKSCERYLATQLRKEGCTYKEIANYLNKEDGYDLKRPHTTSSVNSWFYKQKKSKNPLN